LQKKALTKIITVINEHYMYTAFQ